MKHTIYSIVLAIVNEMTENAIIPIQSGNDFWNLFLFNHFALIQIPIMTNGTFPLISYLQALIERVKKIVWEQVTVSGSELCQMP